MEWWLKRLGKSERRSTWLQDDWQNADKGLFPGSEDGFLRHAVAFPPASKKGTPPSVKTGDKLVYYAVGRGLFFATAEVRSNPYPVETAPWADVWLYWVEVNLEYQRNLISEGHRPELLDIDPARTPIKLRGRQSHVRIEQAEYLMAVDLLIL